MDDVKYPNITVELIGKDSNAFNLIGLVQQGLKKAKVPREEVKKFQDEAMSAGGYDELLVILMSWVNIE